MPCPRAAHAGFSANLYTIVSDTVPRKAVGSVVGIGTHDELMKTCETYQEIVYSQLSQEEVA